MVGGGGLVFGGSSICGDFGVLALMIDVREVMLT